MAQDRLSVGAYVVGEVRVTDARDVSSHVFPDLDGETRACMVAFGDYVTVWLTDEQAHALASRLTSYVMARMTVEASAVAARPRFTAGTEPIEAEDAL